MNFKTSLLFGIHCHQPVDNFSHVIDEATQKCYKPFLEVCALYPEFKFSIHYSGWLLEYLQKNQKDTFKLLQEAVERGSVEFFTGGYYEPILASIPSVDRVAQIKKLNSFIKKHFKTEPKGLWLTERVWDNSIIPDLKACGIEYVIVDDYHFLTVGFKENELAGYYVTEESGQSMKIFPISKELRYRIPFRLANEAADYIGTIKNDAHKCSAVIFDDGEKFGVWPNTYQWVYEKEWLKLFIEAVLKNPEIETAHYRDFAETQKPLGLAYLPTTSYYEMGEWSLKAYDTVRLEALQNFAKSNHFEDESVSFVKGGIWKNFLVKYDESNRIQKRVLELSSVRASLKNKAFDEELYKAETNDVLWHGVFGGLYLPNLRDNAWKFIANAENIRYGEIKNEIVEIADNNMDGYNEAKMISNSLLALFDEKDGGQMTELLLRDKSWNLQNTLTRRKEAYHYKIENAVHDALEHKKPTDESSAGIDTIHGVDMGKLKEYEEHLRFDWHLRNSFVSHVSDFNLSLDSFMWCNYKEYGDFANMPFSISQKSPNSITLVRNGGIYADRRYATKLTKEITLKENKILFGCAIESECPYNLQYLVEFNLHFANLAEIKVDSKPFDGRAHFENISSLGIKDPYTQKTITFRFKQPCDAYLFRVDTVSQSESGFDLTNQGLAIGFSVPFSKYLQTSGELEIR